MIALFLTAALAANAPDRSVPPSVTSADPLALPPLAEEAVGKARVGWLVVPGVRRVVVQVRFHRGALHLDGARSPEATVTGWEWTTAVKGLKPADLEQRLSLLDAAISASVGDRSTTLTLDVPREHLPAALDLFTRVVREPSFPAADLKRDVDEAVRRVRTEAPHSPDALASTMEDAAWYDAADPRSGRVDLDAWEKVSRTDAVQRHRRLLAESPIEVLVSGDVDPASVRPKLAALLDGLGAEGERAPAYPARQPHPGRVVGVDVPEADQAVIVVRLPAPPRTHEDAPAFQAIQHALGGHFLSRLNRNLREEKGLTYGAGSWWGASDTDGAWTFQVQVAEANVGIALHEVDAELDRMVAGGLTSDEQAVFATSVVGSWNTTLATAQRAANAYGDLFLRGEELALGRARMEARRAVRAEDTAAVAARWLGSDDRLVLVVGDRKAVEASLAELGPVTWITAEQAAVGDLGDAR